MAAVGNTVFTPQMWARILGKTFQGLRENAVMGRLVYTDFSEMVASEGNTIHVPFPQSFTARAKTVGNTYTMDTTASTSVDILLDKHYYTSLSLEEIDETVGWNKLVEFHTPNMVKELIRQIDADVLTAMMDFDTFYGDTSTATAIGKLPYVEQLLNDNNVPDDGNRRLIVNSISKRNLEVGLTSTYSDRKATEAIERGKLGDLYSLTSYYDSNIPAVTSTDLSGTVNDTTGAVGDTSLTVTGFSAIPKTGSLMTYAADTTNTYMILDGSTLTELQVYPALKVTPVSTNAVVIKDLTKYQTDFAFHRDGVALISRPMKRPLDGLGTIFNNITDDLSGISVNFKIFANEPYARTELICECLYGVKVLNKSMGTHWKSSGA